MNMLDVIKKRRTIRKYKPDKVPEEMIKAVIEAARWAPSAHNLQPWKFVVVENEEKTQKMADALERKADKLFSGFNIVVRDTAKNMRNARQMIAVYSKGTVTKKFKRFGAPYDEIGNTYEIQSVANAIENILLYIDSIGLGAAVYGMALFCEAEINEILGQSDRLMAIISLGYPDEKPAATGRKPLGEILEFVR